MTRDATTTWLLRLADAVALVALLASIAVVTKRLTDDGGTRTKNEVRAQTTPAPAVAGDRDHDGVPDSKDAAPDAPGAHVDPSDKPEPNAPLPPSNDCQRKGITIREGKEGTCFEPSGRRVLVVNRATEMDLDELDATLGEFHIRRQRTLPLADVTMDVRIFNKLDGLVDVSPDHFGLVLGRDLYGPNLLASERSANTLFRRGLGLRGRHSVRGTITFTVPLKALKRLDRDGNLQVLQFSDGSVETASLTVGVFRTYR